ncbi:carboxylesterase family protein [Mycobacterium tuberculosis]
MLALRWVHRQHRGFGGDQAITFGESAGAHITLPTAAVPSPELFARAISESPAAGMVRSRPSSSRHACHLIGARTRMLVTLMQASCRAAGGSPGPPDSPGMRAPAPSPTSGVRRRSPMDPVEAMRPPGHAVATVGTTPAGPVPHPPGMLLQSNPVHTKSYCRGHETGRSCTHTAAYPAHPAPRRTSSVVTAFGGRRPRQIARPHRRQCASHLPIPI